MKQTRLIFISLFLLLFAAKKNFAQDITEAMLKIDLPNGEWSLGKKQVDSVKDYTVYFFKRNAIIDSKKINVIPNISVIIQSIDKNLEIKSWAEKKNAKTPFDISEILT